MNINNKELGDKIRKVRKNKNITQKQLGEMVSKTESMISRYENGESLPTFDMLERIATALGIDIFRLIRGETPDVYHEPYNLSEYIGKNIKTARELEYMTREDLMSATGIPESKIELFESGKTVPSLLELFEIAKRTHFPVDYFLLHDEFYEQQIEQEESERILLEAFNLLNKAGQKVAIERVKELAEILRYQKNYSEDMKIKED